VLACDSRLNFRTGWNKESLFAATAPTVSGGGGAFLFFFQIRKRFFTGMNFSELKPAPHARNSERATCAAGNRNYFPLMASPNDIAKLPRIKPGRRGALAQLITLQQCVYEAGVKEGVEPRDLAQLSRAWDVLEERKRILRGRPLPGSLKPQKEARTTRKLDYQPLGSET
jgi:hypothetical protein